MPGCTTAILRFPRRYPLILLVFLVPFALWLYYSRFDPLTEWRTGKVLFPGIVGEGNGAKSSSNVQPSESPILNDEEKGSQIQGPKVLLVSSLFTLPSSKRVAQEVTSSLSTFLKQTTTDIYFFTTPLLESTILTARGTSALLPPLIVNTTFSSPFDIPPLHGLEEMYEELPPVSTDGRRQSTTEVAAQAAIPYLLSSASSITTTSTEKPYDYIIYLSPTFFSSSTTSSLPISQSILKSWPSPTRIGEIWSNAVRESGMNPNELIFLMIKGLPHVSMLLWKEHMGPVQNDFADLSIIIGSPSSLLKLSSTFYIYHTYYTQHDLFKGRTDSLLNSLILLQPERYFTIWPNDPEIEFENDIGKGVNSAHNIKAIGGTMNKQHEKDRELGNCGTPKSSMSYLTYYLSSSTSRIQIQSYWDTQRHFPYNLFHPNINLKFWEWNWTVWKKSGKEKDERDGCKLVRVKSLQWLLRRPFGEMWMPPSADVEKSMRKNGPGPGG